MSLDFADPVSPLDPFPSRQRWLGVGWSRDVDSRRAGAEAAGQALCEREAKLLVVFCSDAYELEDLLAEINNRSGGAPLIGCAVVSRLRSRSGYSTENRTGYGLSPVIWLFDSIAAESPSL